LPFFQNRAKVKIAPLTKIKKSAKVWTKKFIDDSFRKQNSKTLTICFEKMSTAIPPASDDGLRLTKA